MTIGNNELSIGMDETVATVQGPVRTINCLDWDLLSIINGITFSAHYEQDCSNTGERTLITFITPSESTKIQVLASASSTAGSRACMYRNPTITNNTGSSLTVWNHNHRLDTPSLMIDTSTNPNTVGQITSFNSTQASNVTGGDRFACIPLVSGGPGSNTLGAARGIVGRVLDYDSPYCFEIESLTNEDNVHWIQLVWHEVVS